MAGCFEFAVPNPSDLTVHEVAPSRLRETGQMGSQNYFQRSILKCMRASPLSLVYSYLDHARASVQRICLGTCWQILRILARPSELKQL